MKYLNTLPNSFIVGEKDNDGNILEQYGFPKGGLTYLIKGNNIKFYLTEDYFYKNVVFSADAPFLINGIPVSVDNLPAALKNIFKVEQEAVDVDTEFDDQSFNPIANAPVTIKFNEVDALQATISGEVESLSGEVATKADIEDIPTNLSELENDMGYITSGEISSDYATKQWVEDQGYLTEHQDISGKMDVSGMTAYTTNDAFSAHTGNTDIHVTASDKQNWNNKSDFSGSYNDLTDKPTIPVVPTNVSDFVNDAGYVTQANIDAAVSGKADTSAVTASLTSLDEKKLDASAYTPTDLSNYYTKDETSGATEIATALEGKADIEDIPTNVSELVNDEGYVTQNDIDESVSGKADTSAVTASITTLSGQIDTVSGDVNTLSGSVESLHGAIGELEGDVSTHTANTDIHVTASDKQTWNNKSDFSGDYNDLTNKPTIPTVPTNVSDFVNDAGYVTQNDIDAAVSGKVNTTDFNTYSASTDARLAEDEEVTSAALNDLDERKLDASAYTPTDLSNYYTKNETSGATEISNALASKADTATTYTKSQVDTAIATKQDTLVSGTNIKTINNESLLGSGNIDIQGGGSYTAGDGIDITNDVISVTGKMDTSSFNTYSASTDARISEDEEVTAAALNALNSNKQDKLTAGENITINGNVISAAGGNNVIELTQAEYDELTDIDPDAFYIITDAAGAVTTGQVQTMINDSISGKADTSAVTEAVSSKMDTSAFTEYSASTDARLGEDEEVTAAGLNALNDALDDKADTSAVTASITAAVSGKQDTLVSGTNIKTINNESILGSGNIDIQGGGKAIVAGTNISVTTGETADTVSCTIPAYFNPNTTKGDINIGTNDGVSSDYGSMVIGRRVRGRGNSTFGYSIGIGVCPDNSNDYSQLYGQNSVGIGRGFKIGKDSYYSNGIDNAVAIGHNAVSRDSGDITIGANTTASGTASVAIGSGATANGTDYKMNLNNQIKVTPSNQVYIYNKDNTEMICLQDQLGGGGVPESAFTAYTASTEARLAEDEEVTAAALNVLNDALSDKADTSAVTESINAAVSGKADTSAFTAHTADTTIHTTSAEKSSWNGAATNASNAITALGGLKLVQLTQTQYDTLATKDASALYIIVN